MNKNYSQIVWHFKEIDMSIMLYFVYYKVSRLKWHDYISSVKSYYITWQSIEKDYQAS